MVFFFSPKMTTPAIITKRNTVSHIEGPNAGTAAVVVVEDELVVETLVVVTLVLCPVIPKRENPGDVDSK